MNYTKFGLTNLSKIFFYLAIYSSISSFLIGLPPRLIGLLTRLIGFLVVPSLTTSLGLAIPTKSAWSIVEMIGAELILDGVYALVLAMQQEVVKQQVEKLAIFPFPTMVLHTMAAWLILEITGAQLIQAGEFALTLSLATRTYNDDGM